MCVTIRNICSFLSCLSYWSFPLIITYIRYLLQKNVLSVCSHPKAVPMPEIKKELDAFCILTFAKLFFQKCPSLPQGLCTVYSLCPWSSPTTSSSLGFLSILSENPAFFRFNIFYNCNDIVIHVIIYVMSVSPTLL